MKSRLPILTLAVVLLGALVFWAEPQARWLLSLATGQGRGAVRPLADPEAKAPGGASQKPTSPVTISGDRAGAWASSPSPALPPSSSTIPSSITPSAPAPDGQALVAQAAQRVFALPSLEAKMRQRIDLFGHELSGSGVYKQQGVGEVKLLRLELKLQAADRVTSLQQVCDGRFLWVRRDSPFDTSLTRIDLREVRRALEAAAGAAADGERDEPNERDASSVLRAASRANQWMALGGLPKLLQGLDNHYEFQPAEARIWNDVPVWVVPGRLKRELLALFLPAQREKILAGDEPSLANFPPQWPDRVVVTLGRDQTLPLFPYRIDFQRTRPPNAKKPVKAPASQAGAGGAGEGADVASVVTLELFEVQAGHEIEQRQFSYTPGNQEVFDDTERFLKNLGL